LLQRNIQHQKEPTVKHTAISAAFQKVGYNPRQMALWKPLKEFFDAGGTVDELSAVVRAILPGEGHTTGADGLSASAPARQPNGDAGASFTLPNGRLQGAPASPPIANGGANEMVLNGQSRVAPAVRFPSTEQNAAVDRELTRNGGKWGNVRYRDLDEMVDEGGLALAIRSYIGHRRGDDRNKPIRELMTPLQFTKLLVKHRKVAA
jgi:hypothetical protein